MKIRKLMNSVILSAVVAFSAPVVQAQGQRGALEDTIALYEELLKSPDVDAATKEELRKMIAQLRQEARDMNSTTRDATQRNTPPPQYRTPAPAPQRPQKPSNNCGRYACSAAD